jgi:hypothetical protein
LRSDFPKRLAISDHKSSDGRITSLLLLLLPPPTRPPATTCPPAIPPATTCPSPRPQYFELHAAGFFFQDGQITATFNLFAKLYKVYLCKPPRKKEDQQPKVIQFHVLTNSDISFSIGGRSLPTFHSERKLDN